MVDRQTEGIAHSTSLIQTSVDRVKAGLSDFAGDARDNGGQLIKAQKRLSTSKCCRTHARHARQFGRRDRRHADDPARPGSDAGDRRAVERASTAARSRSRPRSTAIMCRSRAPTRRNMTMASPTSPTSLCPADARPLQGARPRIIGSAITNVDGYLPTHLCPSAARRRAPIRCGTTSIAATSASSWTNRPARDRERAAGDADDLPHGARRPLHPGQERVRAALLQGPPLGQFRTGLPRRIGLQGDPSGGAAGV
jgi:hypothetical protein